MTNEMLKNLIGKKCTVCSQNSFGVTGVITNIEDNWLEITNDKGIAKYLNADYVTNIDIVAEKKRKTKRYKNVPAEIRQALIFLILEAV